MRKISQNILTLFLAAGFLLGSHNGYLALWEDGKEDPRQIFPCPVSSLPEADQTALQEGIRVRDMERLQQLLADGPEYARKIQQLREQYIANFGHSGEVGGRYILGQLKARQEAKKKKENAK